MGYKLAEQNGESVAVPRLVFSHLGRADGDTVRVALYLLGGNPPDNIMTIAGPGTILCAACMGPLIDWFNRRVSIPLLHRQAA